MRIRDIARIDGFPCGEYNAVTDVKGVRAGHSPAIKDRAGPRLEEGGMAPAHAPRGRGGVVFPPGGTADARGVFVFHASVSSFPLHDPRNARA